MSEKVQIVCSIYDPVMGVWDTVAGDKDNVLFNGTTPDGNTSIGGLQEVVCDVVKSVAQAYDNAYVGITDMP